MDYLPANRRNKSWPIKTLDVGEHFDLPLDDAQSVRSVANYRRLKENKHFTVRKISDTLARCTRLT